jgi:outer membrane immunogenic protein
MRKVSAFAGISLLLAGPAFAADLAVKAPVYKAPPPAPVYNWTGFYFGANGGYGWSPYSNQLADPTNTFPFGGLAPKGGFGGGQIGANWQWPTTQIVLGIEADIQGGRIGDSSTWTPFPGTSTTSTSEIDSFGTVRGRLGYAFDRLLVYGTGGFAYGHVNNSEVFTNGIAYNVSNESTGWVAGAGIEWAFAPRWSLKSEYQYIQLGKNDPVSPLSGPFSSFPGTTLHNDAFSTFRVGVNYKFW